MALINLSKGKVALVDDEDFEFLSQWKWYAHKSRYTFYAVRMARKSEIGSDGVRKMISMHSVIMSRILGREIVFGELVDHKYEDGLDNRRTELRLADYSGNATNRRHRIDSKSGFRGVCSKGDKWLAYINKNGIRVWSGVFDSKEEAAEAYDNAAREVHGEFAKFNNAKVA